MECQCNNPNEKLQERLIFVLKRWYNCGDFPNSQLAEQNNRLHTSPPSKPLAMFVTLTTTDGGRSTGPSNIVLTRKSKSPEDTTQLGSFASSALASDKEEMFLNFGDGLLCCRGHYVIKSRSLTRPRRRRRRERHQRKGLMSRTMSVHVRYKSLPSITNQQLEITKFCVV